MIIPVNVPADGAKFNLYTTVANNITNLRIIPKNVYDSGFTAYQPYALPNVKLTPALIECVDNGKKNLLPNRGSLSKDNITYTWVDGNVTISGTKTTGANYVEVFPLTLLSNLGLADKFVISNNGTNGYLSVIFWSQSQGYTSSYDVISGSSIINIPAGYTHILVRIGTLSVATGTISETIQPMLCEKSLWDVSQKYVPYAMSNAELTDKINKIGIVKIIDPITPSAANTYECITASKITLPAGKILRLTASCVYQNTYATGIAIVRGTTKESNKTLAVSESTTDYNALSASTVCSFGSNQDIYVFLKCNSTDTTKLVLVYDIISP